MVDPSTKPEDISRTGDAVPAAPPTVPMLVVLWSADEPERIGELLPPPHGNPGPSRIFGRGAASAEDPERRLLLVRHRPGVVLPADPIGSPSISRVQLSLRAKGAHSIEVKNLGQCRLLLNGKECAHGEVSPGDTIELGKQLALLCVRRPAWMMASQPIHEFPFGHPDEHGIVGESPVIWGVREQIAFVGPRAGHVFVHGESGTGKELVAKALHMASARSKKKFIARNAATFPEGLIDAELFGNLRNYPNPGIAERPGLIGEVDGGTLFLDEFAELPMNLQARLLRVLDAGEYTRLGEAQPRRSNFRLIAATNRAASALKHDVLARMPFRIELPSLNERREDIPLLANHMLRRIAHDDPDIAGRFFDDRRGIPMPRLSLPLVRALLSHTYTTHTRELEALLWRSLAASRAKRLDVWPANPLGEERGAEQTTTDQTDHAGADEAVDNPLHPTAVQAALDAHNGSIEQTARTLGMSRYALSRLIRKYELVVRKKPGS